MRLINADELFENIAKIDDLRRLSTKTIGEAVDETPTVNAIPLDFIYLQITELKEKYHKKKDEHCLNLVFAYAELLNAWDEKNERE